MEEDLSARGRRDKSAENGEDGQSREVDAKVVARVGSTGSKRFPQTTSAPRNRRRMR